MYITVRAGTMPGEIKEYVVPQGSTVGQVIATAGLPTSGYDIRVNAVTATNETVVNDGALIVLAKQIKGN